MTDEQLTKLRQTDLANLFDEFRNDVEMPMPTEAENRTGEQPQRRAYEGDDHV
jgi:hypothetical protein